MSWLLIDGIKVGSTTLGTTPFEFIPMDSVERVEIIKGLNLVFMVLKQWVAVIQIFTRKGSATEKPSITLEFRREVLYKYLSRGWYY